MLNKRCLSILSTLLKSNKPVIIDELAKTFNISNRTIRYDLDKIDDYLREKKLPLLSRKPNFGIEIVFTEDQKKEIIGDEVGIDVYVLSQEERVKAILFELIQEREFTTINNLADKLYVSRGTILKDIPQVKDWLNNNKIKLITYKSRGIKAVGEEKYFRKAAALLMAENIDTNKEIDIIKDRIYKNDEVKLKYQVNRLFEDIDIAYIEHCLNIAEEQLETTFSDDAFNALVIHIAIAIKRIQLRKDIVMDLKELKRLEKSKEFVIAASVAKLLEDKFKITIPNDEIGYITIHLLGSNVTYTDDMDKDNWIRHSIVTTEIIENMERLTGLNLLNDRQLFEGLLQHIRPAMYRFKHELDIKNPLIGEIKCTYNELFNQVRKSTAFLEDELHIKISDEEIGYIVLHFGASLERNNSREAKILDVLVVCATGIGTARLVSSRLNSLFDVNIVDSISYHGVDKALKKHNVDLIVTTVPLNIKNIKCVKVSPFLTDENITELSIILSKAKQVKNNKKLDIDKLIKVINENCNINDFNKLRIELSEYFGIQNGNENSNYKPRLVNFVNDKFVEANSEAYSWEEAIQKSGEILLRNGCITSSYISSMINIVKNIGPYIVMAPGVAIAHARPEDGVFSVGLSILTLRTPICFGNEDNDPVKVVACICSTDHSSHMTVLSELVEIIDKEGFIEHISKAENKQGLIELLLEKVI
ncbi:transcription antiterminator [Clostridium sp. YIM B02515]|uniref:Transcription antiterminator n=1 Tax=Clostridium rhizosphaerae TaxID=2803861 RepID=A0ABS1T8G8_9CLOT|nr:BglG family transcription antiterminator [Clostridium rhizosphaerae]MBL4935641.1 transcription antiterminator [Clostridium rhizosphaerae]